MPEMLDHRNARRKRCFMESRIRAECCIGCKTLKGLKVDTTITAKIVDEIKGKHISEDGRIVCEGSIFSS